MFKSTSDASAEIKPEETLVNAIEIFSLLFP